MPIVTKQVFLASLQCPGYAWGMLRSEKPREPSESERLRMDQGREVGALARQVWGGGVFVPPGPTAQAAERTRRLLADATQTVIYEATFQTDEFVAKADILRREPGGWHLLEVKQAANDKPEDVEDLAYTVMAARQSGVPISRASLVLVSKDYRKGMPPGNLFVEVDHTSGVDDTITAFAEHWRTVGRNVVGETRPAPELKIACRYCEEFSDSCAGKGIPDPLFHLPRLHESKFAKLRTLGVDRITAIPEDFTLTERQEVVRRAVVSGKAWISPDLGNALAAVQWPAYYLDFETTATVLPLYDDVAPHEAIPTQYSIHVYTDLDTELDHRWFLADHRVDERRALAARLIADLGDAGSIIVYTSYEKRIMGHLAGLYPDLAPALERCRERLVDLEAILGSHYYHPGFRGKTSIKVTLPVMVGDPYKRLPINNGGAASALFARMARGELSEADCRTIRENLLVYCRQDTKAMVDVHRALAAAVAA